ncbi:guanine nucleotide exchange factor synembryn-domain-containing protein [Stachybotrys elegans]|uniref:Guanine nucleotide exchange factor synembryn-domain-containing protein n=1 Tax=Stachybotrys elegans TaxID=80388 RepID=A0A8K0SWF3_9HYPO|nr:guanine nucleotide exchange factor synembryn-domain-containing protein [Stachybotrys elegans]
MVLLNQATSLLPKFLSVLRTLAKIHHLLPESQALLHHITNRFQVLASIIGIFPCFFSSIPFLFQVQLAEQYVRIPDVIMASQGVVMTKDPVKLKAVSDLVSKLVEDVKTATLLPEERTAALDELKIHGRDPLNADPLFTKESIHMLLKHGFHSPAPDTARAALRVLANAMLLKPHTRNMFVDQGFAPIACKELKGKSWEDEFLMGRLIFLCTYGTAIDLEELIDKHHLADNVVDRLGQHAKLMTNKGKSPSDAMEEMALTETLKLLFNVTHHCPERIGAFNPAIPHIINLLWKTDIAADQPLGQPHGSLVNALLNLDLSPSKYKSTLFPKPINIKVVGRLIDILHASLAAYGENEVESIITPLVSLIRQVYEYAPEDVKLHMRARVLPSEQDRKDVLGRGTSPSAVLLKYSTHAAAPALQDMVSHLLFDMSNRDASKFVENVGYGFASGFLFQQNISVPESAMEAFSTGSNPAEQKPVNPITGQFLDEEKYPDVPEWTEEEKEREAEKLFVLFERLKKNGVIQVENPIAQAVREGRYREAKEDEVEEVD